MVRADKFDTETSQIDRLTIFYNLFLHRLRHHMLFELVFDQAHSKLCCINRSIYFLENIWKRSNMILVSMGDHKASDLINIFLEVCDIRNDKVNSQHIISGE